jgi:hypothetical protein
MTTAGCEKANEQQEQGDKHMAYLDNKMTHEDDRDSDEDCTCLPPMKQFQGYWDYKESNKKDDSEKDVQE